MTPRLLLVIAAVALGVAVAALIAGSATLFGTALASTMAFGIAADILREQTTTTKTDAGEQHP
ncbi:hypothetical protein [Mycolicibacterium senegalense]|uniref:Secreted protein n=1 Tax=Mycolicibacterium senegalense TaxID=1796 RepID=A0ABR5G1H9_9MYCO|nr:hypothetical protein [Mycolicibacterium senegalense]KLI05776.1 hypothetical protein AA982_22705 [Mycolicibacterium senegalense]KLO54060.1 hypothetical protein ABW05_23875 [Mycolicibacterium senegalense]KLO54126.1 hypothetical protein ABW05_24315 [Mycolicibacterium senegalense]